MKRITVIVAGLVLSLLIVVPYCAAEPSFEEIISEWQQDKEDERAADEASYQRELDKLDRYHEEQEREARADQRALMDRMADDQRAREEAWDNRPR